MEMCRWFSQGLTWIQNCRHVSTSYFCGRNGSTCGRKKLFKFYNLIPHDLKMCRRFFRIYWNSNWMNFITSWEGGGAFSALTTYLYREVAEDGALPMGIHILMHDICPLLNQLAQAYVLTKQLSKEHFNKPTGSDAGKQEVESMLI